MRRFEFREAGGSNKFWEVDVEKTTLTVRFGKIGTNGQTQTKSFPTEEKAKSERDKLVREKTGKGYVEITGDAAAPKPEATKEPDPTPAAAPKRSEPKAKKTEPASTDEVGWIDAGNGYRLSLRDGKLVCKNAKGALLASVPKEVKGSDAAQQLSDVKDWLEAHDKQCIESVETWMLRSLPTPRAVLAAVWEDASFRAALENAVVAPVRDGEVDTASAGFFRGVDEKKGIGVVNLDGETVWIDAETVVVPHPILLPELDELRALAGELSLKQGIAQLFRETFGKPANLEPTKASVSEFKGGKFAMLMHALGVCKKHGFRVSGGSAICRVWQGGKVYEARFWIGSDDPTSESYTDELVFVDDRERPLKLVDVDAVAFSEGMRMASTIYGARAVEKQEGAS